MGAGQTMQSQVNEQPLKEQRVRQDWKSFVDRLSHKGIVRNLPFLAFVVLLCIVYISNSQKTIQTQRELNRNRETIKELRWRYVDVKSRLLKAGMESEIIRNAADIGLKPLALPAYEIDADSLQTTQP